MQIHKLITKNRINQTKNFESVSIDAFEIPLCIVDPVNDQVLANNSSFSELWSDLQPPSKPSVLFANQLGELITFTEAVDEGGAAQTHDLVPTNTATPNSLWIIQGSKITHNENYALLLVVLPIQLLNQAYVEYLATGTTKTSVSDRRQFRYLYQQESSLKNLILDAAGEGIYGVDNDGRATFINKTARNILGLEEEDILGKDVHQLIHHHFPNGDPYPPEDCAILNAVKDGQAKTVATEVFWRSDNQPIPVEYTATPLDLNDKDRGSVVVFRDISNRLTRESALQDALAEVAKLKERLQSENEYLKNEMREAKNLSSSMIGQSKLMQSLRSQISVVGPTDATVLIMGETGTGKELIAEAIHENSPRREDSLIKVNCGAIPRELFESEFFGHVKGAFSGATADRIGRFELADGGTLFLDEIGELPPELQPKLLRVIQEGEFERIGDVVTRKVNVRIIAATNKNLASLASKNEFREDLYFRLNVFPIDAPALRNRLDDIPLLLSYFSQTICAKLALPEPHYDDDALRSLTSYSWPGNVRELQNVIERGCIVAKGGRFNFDYSSLETERHEIRALEVPPPINCDYPSTLEDIQRLERELILQTLRKTGGRVSGLRGAAELLKVKPTTLYSKLKRINT